MIKDLKNIDMSSLLDEEYHALYGRYGDIFLVEYLNRAKIDDKYKERAINFVRIFNCNDILVSDIHGYNGDRTKSLISLINVYNRVDKAKLLKALGEKLFLKHFFVLMTMNLINGKDNHEVLEYLNRTDYSKEMLVELNLIIKYDVLMSDDDDFNICQAEEVVLSYLDQVTQPTSEEETENKYVTYDIENEVMVNRDDTTKDGLYHNIKVLSTPSELGELECAFSEIPSQFSKHPLYNKYIDLLKENDEINDYTRFIPWRDYLHDILDSSIIFVEDLSESDNFEYDCLSCAYYCYIKDDTFTNKEDLLYHISKKISDI